MPDQQEPVTIDRDTLHSAYELLMDTWVGMPCERPCSCVLHGLRAVLGIEETDEDYVRRDHD